MTDKERKAATQKKYYANRKKVLDLSQRYSTQSRNWQYAFIGSIPYPQLCTALKITYQKS